ncbi:MAG: hypothetical protein U0Y68_23595 [Blastocatellia bacterium]
MLRGGRIFDGTGAAVRNATEVVIKPGKIPIRLPQPIGRPMRA